MAKARQRLEWRTAATVATVIANAHRDPKLKPEPWTVDDLDPTAEQVDKVVRGSITALKALLPRSNR